MCQTTRCAKCWPGIHSQFRGSKHESMIFPQFCHGFHTTSRVNLVVLSYAACCRHSLCFRIWNRFFYVSFLLFSYHLYDWSHKIISFSFQIVITKALKLKVSTILLFQWSAEKTVLQTGKYLLCINDFIIVLKKLHMYARKFSNISRAQRQGRTLTHTLKDKYIESKGKRRKRKR